MTVTQLPYRDDPDSPPQKKKEKTNFEYYSEAEIWPGETEGPGVGGVIGSGGLGGKKKVGILKMILACFYPSTCGGGRTRIDGTLHSEQDEY